MKRTTLRILLLAVSSLSVNAALASEVKLSTKVSPDGEILYECRGKWTSDLGECVSKHTATTKKPAPQIPPMGQDCHPGKPLAHKVDRERLVVRGSVLEIKSILLTEPFGNGVVTSDWVSKQNLLAQPLLRKIGAFDSLIKSSDVATLIGRDTKGLPHSQYDVILSQEAPDENPVYRCAYPNDPIETAKPKDVDQSNLQGVEIHFQGLRQPRKQLIIHDWIKVNQKPWENFVKLVTEVMFRKPQVSQGNQKLVMVNQQSLGLVRTLSWQRSNKVSWGFAQNSSQSFWNQTEDWWTTYTEIGVNFDSPNAEHLVGHDLGQKKTKTRANVE